MEISIREMEKLNINPCNICIRKDECKKNRIATYKSCVENNIFSYNNIWDVPEEVITKEVINIRLRKNKSDIAILNRINNLAEKISNIILNEAQSQLHYRMPEENGNIITLKILSNILTLNTGKLQKLEDFYYWLKQDTPEKLEEYEMYIGSFRI